MDDVLDLFYNPRPVHGRISDVSDGFFTGPIDDVPYRALSNMTGVDLSNSTVHYREENNGDTNTDFVYILNEAGVQNVLFSNYFGMVYLLDLNAMVTTYFVHGKSDRHVVELTNPESLSRDSASSI